MIDKSLMLDKMGRYITQGLFLELGYTEFSIYTLKERDYEYNGKLMPSIKRLYLEAEDTTEYDFATEHFCGWNHWQRLVENKAIRVYIDEWREELELKLRARAVKQMMVLAEEGSYQASKWLADRGWDNRAAGRPSKAEKAGHKAAQDRIKDEYGADILRLVKTA